VALQGVLVDRGRLLRKAAQPVKIEGRSQFADAEPGDWFGCRLFLPASPESYDPATVRRRVVIVPTLLYGLYDDSGNLLEVLNTDEIEVESDDLGNATWQVTAAPEPLRKKNGLIGWQTTLRRVATNEFEPKV
jgi:hypothetical protein